MRLRTMGISASVPRGEGEWSWPEAMGSSPCMSSRVLLAFRALLCAVFAGHTFYDVWRHFDSGFYFMYLTHISLWWQLVTSVLLVFATSASRHALGAQGGNLRPGLGGFGEPAVCRVALAAFCLQLPLSFMVVLLYWTLEEPIWHLPSGFRSSYDNLYVHGFQCFGMVILLLSGRLPFRFDNWGWLMLFGACYVIWTFLHFKLDLGTKFGCDEYPRDECPIYNSFDWHHGLRTFILGLVLVFVICPIVMTLLWLLGRLRLLWDPCWGSSDRSSREKSLEDSLTDSDTKLSSVSSSDDCEEREPQRSRSRSRSRRSRGEDSHTLRDSQLDGESLEECGALGDTQIDEAEARPSGDRGRKKIGTCEDLSFAETQVVEDFEPAP
ncbi:unnamed protein product, partial [Effrenium voratum]